MSTYVRSLHTIDKTWIAAVGGKGANLGEMIKAGFPVLPGFCITTTAYQAMLDASPNVKELIEKLEHLDPKGHEEIQVLGQQIRDAIRSVQIPEEMIESITKAWEEHGENNAYAIRSSATAEDLSTASFAGQQDTYLNIKGKEALIRSIQSCWASLFSDRAILYRFKNGFDHRSVQLAVVVQQMANPDVSGIMFTADPVNGDRQTTTIDASFGLGEALVSGLVTPDFYKVRENEITEKQVSQKTTAMFLNPEGDTVAINLPAKRQTTQALTEEQMLELSQLGRRVQSHYGMEQDIEWCFVDDQFYLLQTRPITSLYPKPDMDDDQLHVFFSFGHQQMMTDPISPMGISVLKIFPEQLGNDDARTAEVGGRLYMDSTKALQSDIGKFSFMSIMKDMDEQMAQAVSKIMQRSEFQAKGESASNSEQSSDVMEQMIPQFTQILQDLFEADGESAWNEAESYKRESLETLNANLQNTSGAERIAAIENDLAELIKGLRTHDIHYAITGMVSYKLLTTLMDWWLDYSEDAFIKLGKSLPYNVTSDMNLFIGDLADQAREHPELIHYMRETNNENFYQGLESVSGGEAFKQELDRFLTYYGARCPGEIDLARPRWYEKPHMLISSILGHIDNTKPGEHHERFDQGRIEAEEAAESILAQLPDKPNGPFKHKIISRLITVYREFMGMREHHKHVLILLMEVVKKALLEEADQLVQAGKIQRKEDIFYLTLSEVKHLLEECEEDAQALIDTRKETYQYYERLTPPRVMTSEGEIIFGGQEQQEVPEGTLVGTPVSPGIIEGYAKVVNDPNNVTLNDSSILVATFTDPGWTPLFQQAKGLVLEVGGLMTHGTVVAREYGIPAVVGVEKAMEQIQDGQWICVDGSNGYVTIE